MVLQDKKIHVVASDKKLYQALDTRIGNQTPLFFHHDLNSLIHHSSQQSCDVILLDMEHGRRLDYSWKQKINSHPEKQTDPLIFLVMEPSDIDKELQNISFHIFDEIFISPPNPKELIDRLRARYESSEQRLAYDPQLIKLFTTSTRDILEFYSKQSITLGKPLLSKNLDSKMEVTGVISFISNNTRGMLAIDFEASFFDIISKNYFQDESQDQEQAAIFDFAAELCNQVLGKFKQQMANLGHAVEASLPKFFTEKNVRIFSDPRLDIVEVPLTSPEFECLLRFNLY